MAKIAKKTNPKLWEQAKREALAKAGKHSARAMMQAVQIYKKKGGGYAGPKTGKEGIVEWAKSEKKAAPRKRKRKSV